jgi:hypothetical protein
MARNERFTAGEVTGGSGANPFSLLGISRGADELTIKKAYRRLARERHPDLHGVVGEQAMKELNVARTLAEELAGSGADDPTAQDCLVRALADALNLLNPAYRLQTQQVHPIRLEDLAPGVTVQEVKRAA